MIRWISQPLTGGRGYERVAHRSLDSIFLIASPGEHGGNKYFRSSHWIVDVSSGLPG